MRFEGWLTLDGTLTLVREGDEPFLRPPDDQNPKLVWEHVGEDETEAGRAFEAFARDHYARLSELARTEFEADGTGQHALVIQQPTFCTRCRDVHHIQDDIHLRITRVKRTEEGWAVYGVGIRHIRKNLAEFTDTCICGSWYDAIMKIVPIEIAAYKCPACKTADTLEYEPQLVDVVAYPKAEFEVLVTCKKCRRKTTLRRLIKNVAALIKIKFGPTEVSLGKDRP